MCHDQCRPPGCTRRNLIRVGKSVEGDPEASNCEHNDYFLPLGENGLQNVFLKTLQLCHLFFCFKRLWSARHPKLNIQTEEKQCNTLERI